MLKMTDFCTCLQHADKQRLTEFDFLAQFSFLLLVTA